MGQDFRFFRSTSDWYPRALRLRHRVLRAPLGLTFTALELEQDKRDTHFALTEGEDILGCLTLMPASPERIKMRQVAVVPEQQGKGVGKRLSAFAEDYARQHGFKIIYCHARENAVPFYTAMGYKIISDRYTEVGLPHFTMEKEL